MGDRNFGAPRAFLVARRFRRLHGFTAAGFHEFHILSKLAFAELSSVSAASCLFRAMLETLIREALYGRGKAGEIELSVPASSFGGAM
jgi:hypothetical protein